MNVNMEDAKVVSTVCAAAFRCAIAAGAILLAPQYKHSPC
jgi:hypothetical protein